MTTASAIGIPIGIGAGIYLSEYGRSRFGDLIRFTADVLNGVPSIVVGIVAYGLVGEDEMAAGRALRPGIRLNRKLTLDDAKAMSFAQFDRAAPGPARFKAGDPVRTKNLHPATHTRLPRYARGKLGRVEAVRGYHVFPDTAAVGAGENPQWLYTVVFTGRELWGEEADPAIKVSIEAFEPYLMPV